MTAAGIPTLFIGLGVIGLLLIGYGLLVDAFNDVNNEMLADGSIPYSQQRADCWNFLNTVFSALGIIIVLGYAIWFILNCIAEHSGGAW